MENKSYDEVRVLPYTGEPDRERRHVHELVRGHPSLAAELLRDLVRLHTRRLERQLSGARLAVSRRKNLGHACEAAGLTWRAYSENLPSAGATGCSYDGSASTGLYTRKHDPWTYFSNLTTRTSGRTPFSRSTSRRTPFRI
jgi:hypothetical protein